MAIKRIGQILIDLGLIDEHRLGTMLETQAARGGELLGRVGVTLGFYSEEQLGEAPHQLGIGDERCQGRRGVLGRRRR